MSEENLITFQYTEYSDFDLEEFHKEMQEYLVEREIDFPKKDKIKFYDHSQFFKDNKALSERGAVLTTKPPQPLRETNYGILSNKIEQWNKWKNKKKFIKKKKVEGLEELAKGMNFK